jgi:hypothetical protein
VESAALEAVENVHDGARRIPPGVGTALDLAVDDGYVEMDLVHHQLVGRAGLDISGFEGVGREVLDVVGDDHLGARPDGGREDVSIVGVGQLEGVDERLMADDETVTYRGDHQLPRPTNLQLGDVGASAPNGAERLVEDRLGPPRLDETRLREPDEQVARRAGV